MANILDKVVGSPIAFGALNGLMESFVTGRTAEKQEAKAKAIAAQKKREEGFQTLTTTALTSTDLSLKFMTLPGFASHRKQLYSNNDSLYNSILLNAHGNRKLSEIETKVIDQSVNDASFAKRFLRSNPDFKSNYPSSYAIVLANAAGDSLNSGEEKLFNTVKSKAQAISLRDSLFPIAASSKMYKGSVTATLDGGEPKGLDGKALKGEDTEYRDNNATSSNLFWALQARAENDVEGTDYKGIDSTLINTMSKAIEDSDKPLDTAQYFIDNLEKGSDGSVLDTQALFFLNGFKTKYAKKNDKFSVKDLLKESIEQITNNVVETESEKGMFAKQVLNVDAIKDLVTSGEMKKYATSDKPDERSIYTNYLALKSSSDMMDKVDNKTGTAGISFGGVNFGKDIESINKNINSMNTFLQGVNDYKDSGGKGIVNFVSNLKVAEKAEFLSLIKSTITNHDREIITETNEVSGERINNPGQSYVKTFGNLAEIPEIKAHIREQIGESPEGFSVASKNIAPPSQQNLGTDNPLPNNQVKLIDDTIVTLDNDFLEFAAKKGYVDNPRKLLQDDGYFALLTQDGLEDAGGGVLQPSNKMFKVVNTISKLVPNIKQYSSLRTRDVARITRAIINNDINENNDVFDIVAALQDDTFKLEKQTNKRGYTVAQVDRAIKKLTDNTLDISKLQKNRASLDSYSSVLKEAINTINFIGNKSQLELSFVSTVEDLFTSSSAPINALGRYALDKFNMSDFVNEKEATDVMNSMNKFMSDSRRGNARLDSAMITIAYNQAKSLDPSGRVSDKDFNAALKTVSGGSLGSVFITKDLLEGFLDKVEQQQVVYDKISDVFSTVDDNSTMIMIKKNIRTLKAIPLYNKIRTMRTSIDAVREYRNSVELNNGSLPVNSRYQISRIAGFNYRGVAAENRVFEAVFKNGGQQIAVGIPVYVDQVGRMLNAQELKNRGFNR